VRAEPIARRGVPVDPTLRILAIGTLVIRAGGGALVTAFALFFTREVHFTATRIGVVLSVAALAGMAAQVPAGHLGDVRGPRGVMCALTVASGVSLLLLVFTRHSLWLLTAVMVLAEISLRRSGAVRNGFVARVATGGRGVQFKAYLRAVTNVAMAGGALLGGVAL
jgi:predicted MFS family arabinose efflux permease